MTLPFRRGSKPKVLKRRGFVAGLFAAAGAHVASAQQLGLPQSDLLTITPDRVFAGTLLGKRMSAELEAAGRALAAENRQIELGLADEERALTEQRAGMQPAEFRALADAFDEKAQRIRAEQRDKVVGLNQRSDETRRKFLETISPILQQIMIEAGASVILERSVVFMSANVSDITELAISRVDQVIGDGSGPVREDE